MTRFLLLLLLILLAGCATGPLEPAGVPQITPTPRVADPGTATLPPPSSPAPLPVLTSPPPTPLPLRPTATPGLSALAARLQAVAAAELGGGDFAILYLEQHANGAGRWLAHASGGTGPTTADPARLLLYSYAAGVWTLEATASLPEGELLATDGATVTPAAEGPWIELQTSRDGGGSCYFLRAVAPLAASLAHCHSSAASSGLQDLDGDGIAAELLLNETDEAVFCAACGVGRPALRLLTWREAAWVEQTLAPLPADVAEPLRSATDRALELAQAGLWQEASAALDTVPAVGETARWNRLLLDQELAWRRQLLEESAYPLLNYLYAGDFAGAIDVMRPYPPAQIFAVETPLVADTPAEGYVDVLTAEILQSTERALAAQPELAAAHFLRAWALYLEEPDNFAAAEAALAQADALAPGNALIADSLFYFYNELRYRP